MAARVFARGSVVEAMSVAAIVRYPVGGDPPDSAPNRILRTVSGVDIEVESLVPLGETVPVYFWGLGETLDEFESALRAEATVEELTVLERVEGGCLYSAQWYVDDPLIACVSRADGALIEAHGSGDEWEFTIWFERDEHTARFQECCEERDVPMRVERLRSLSELSEEGVSALTSDQREALVLAYERGYFEDPRETTQEELAEELNISPTAVSSLLRRGLDSLIGDTLSEPGDG